MTLELVIERLDEAKRLLNEADTIGLWVKSDDCSDNRRKRQALREADWAASGALREITAPHHEALANELRALVTALEALPDLVTDTMGTNLELDVRIRDALEQLENVRAHAVVRSADGS